jgi:hypothetical protein
VNENVVKRKPNEKNLSYSIFFNNYESIFVLMACIFCMITLYHYETILSVHLTKEMGFKE